MLLLVVVVACCCGKVFINTNLCLILSFDGYHLLSVRRGMSVLLTILETNTEPLLSSPDASKHTQEKSYECGGAALVHLSPHQVTGSPPRFMREYGRGKSIWFLGSFVLVEFSVVYLI